MKGVRAKRPLPFEVEAILFGKSESTKRVVERLVGRFLERVGKPLSQITREDVDRYLLEELAGKKQAAQLLLLYLEKALEYAGRSDVAEHCRARRRGIRIREEERRRGYLTDEELARVLRVLGRWASNPFDEVKRRAALLFKLMILTGARLSEALSVTRDSIGDGVVVVKGKGGKVAAKPVPDPQLLEEIRKLGPRPFPLSPRTVRRKFKELLREAGLPGERVERLKVHDLRRTFALLLYRRARDIEAVKAFLGHAFAKTTEVYLGKGVEEIEAQRRAEMARELASFLQSLSKASTKSSASSPSSG